LTRALARRALVHLISTQEHDGAWSQNMWLDGTPNFRGIQLDEVAMPILLASMLARYDASSDVDPWPMVRAAAAYVVRSGRRLPQIAGRRKAATHRIRWRRKSPRSSPRQNSPIERMKISWRRILAKRLTTGFSRSID
jgi:hypothetical protein